MPAMVAAVVLVALPGVAAGTALMSRAPDVPTPAAAAGSDDQTEESSDDDSEKGDKTRRGYGPPSWARQGHPGKGTRSAWKDAWRDLSPAQRSDLMEKLAREHADGMKAFGACVEAARSECEKPLPPGHAKRL
jgi:hypothetical protein